MRGGGYVNHGVDEQDEVAHVAHIWDGWEGWPDVDDVKKQWDSLSTVRKEDIVAEHMVAIRARPLDAPSNCSFR